MKFIYSLTILGISDVNVFENDLSGKKTRNVISSIRQGTLKELYSVI